REPVRQPARDRSVGGSLPRQQAGPSADYDRLMPGRITSPRPGDPDLARATFVSRRPRLRLPANPAVIGQLTALAHLRGSGPPPVQLHHAGLDQVQAGEETGDL